MMGENNQINMFDDDSLLDWTEIDKGGFGSVYKARHGKMGHDVAIKLLQDVSVEASLLKEATFQKVFSCKFVLRVYGMYEGIPPNKTVKQKGIVMEFMTRGSIMDLCKNLQGPPPFPLACRLIQEVASGMRFLHSMGILHRDLKMQNVMLSEELHAKLADFGLCTMSATCCPSNEEEIENSGTLKYTPPEAYDINYKPVRSFDVYSFAIFLWAILSGEEPFPYVRDARLCKSVAKGQRPTLDELAKQEKAGMSDLLDLMQKCWNGDPTQRPTFEEITPMVKNVYSKHKSKIIHEVYEVLKQLENLDRKKELDELYRSLIEKMQRGIEKEHWHWQMLDSDWTQITCVGPRGETYVLRDHKTGKQYHTKDAIKEGKITEYDLQQYKKGKIPVSEFALMCCPGVDKKQQQLNSVLPKSATPINSAPLDLSNTEETYPIAGVMDTNTGTCFTIHNATQLRLIDRTTAQRLLEAQAATGGIIDIQNKDRYTVHKAVNRSLIEERQLQRLLNAEKAFTGVEDPTTRRILSVGELIQNGWMLKETARRYMVVQLLTGGLVNPKTGGRMSVTDAYTSKMIDSTMMRELQAETTYEKYILDPLTQEKINYKQALDRCKKDPKSGLPMLPTSSKGTGYTTGSNSFKYS